MTTAQPNDPPVGGRRAAARRQRRRRRRQQTAAALIAGVLLALGATYYFAQRDTQPPPRQVESTARTQQTVLLQLADPVRASIGNALLVHDPSTSTGAVVLVPSPVLAAPPGSQAVPFSQILQTSSEESPRDALSDLVGVTIDSSWVLDQPTAETLVDELGGIAVDVDQQVLGGADGRQVVVAAGAARLTGGQAFAYASHLAPGEQEQARLARMQDFLDGVLEALPVEQAQVLALLDRLGDGSVLSGTEPTRLATFLLGVKADRAESTLMYDTLPTVPVEIGGGEPSLRLDGPAATVVVERLLAASVPPSARAGGHQVKVFNGVGTPMLGAAVRDRLLAADLGYVPGGNAARFGLATTEIQIGDPTPAKIALGNRVAEALGVPLSGVRTSAPTSVADVIVIVGADFVDQRLP